MDSEPTQDREFEKLISQTDNNGMLLVEVNNKLRSMVNRVKEPEPVGVSEDNEDHKPTGSFKTMEKKISENGLVIQHIRSYVDELEKYF